MGICRVDVECCLQLRLDLSETREGRVQNPPHPPTPTHPPACGHLRQGRGWQRLQPLNHKGRFEGLISRKFTQSQSELKGVWWGAHPMAGPERG